MLIILNVLRSYVSCMMSCPQDVMMTVPITHAITDWMVDTSLQHILYILNNMDSKMIMKWTMNWIIIIFPCKLVLIICFCMIKSWEFWLNNSVWLVVNILYYYYFCIYSFYSPRQVSETVNWSGTTLITFDMEVIYVIFDRNSVV